MKIFLFTNSSMHRKKEMKKEVEYTQRGSNEERG